MLLLIALRPPLRGGFVNWLGAVANVMPKQRRDAESHGNAAQPLEWALPQLYEKWDGGILGQVVLLRLINVMEHVNHVCALNALRIVDTSVFVGGFTLDLGHPFFGGCHHVF